MGSRRPHRTDPCVVDVCLYFTKLFSALIVQATLGFSVRFLIGGVGLSGSWRRSHTTPEWGSMLAMRWQFRTGRAWLGSTFPGLMICHVLAFNLMRADGLVWPFDPKLKQ